MTAGVRAAFFDLDGTLMDREPLMEQAIMAVFGRAGAPMDHERASALVGRAWQDVHRVLGVEQALDLDVEAFLHEVLACADQLVADGFETRVLAGGRELVERLHSAGVPVLLVTGSLRREADTAIAHLGIAPFLTGSLAAEEYRRGKPHPECYLAAMAMLGLDPVLDGSATVVFEDSEVGVASGLAAGLRVIATSAANRAPGHSSHQDLSAAHAIVNELDEVTDELLTQVLHGG